MISAKMFVKHEVGHAPMSIEKEVREICADLGKRLGVEFRIDVPDGTCGLASVGGYWVNVGSDSRCLFVRFSDNKAKGALLRPRARNRLLPHPPQERE